MKLSGKLPVDETNFTLTAFPKNYTLPAVTEGGTANARFVIELDSKTPVADQEVSVYRVDKGNEGKVIPADRVKVNGNNLEVYIGTNGAGGGVAGDGSTIDGLAQNDSIMIGSYKYQQDKAQVINIAAEQVGTNVAVTLKQPLYGSDRKVKMWRQTHFHKCSLGTEFTQSSATEMAEQNTTTTFTILKDPKQENLGFIAYVPVTPAYGTGNAPFSMKKKQK